MRSRLALAKRSTRPRSAIHHHSPLFRFPSTLVIYRRLERSPPPNRHSINRVQKAEMKQKLYFYGE